MTETANSFNANNSISVSRNKPLALIVGVAGFLGSHVAEQLLKQNIQIIGVDDFSTGNKINLVNLVRNKDFHLVNESVNNSEILRNKTLTELPRLDYAFFLAFEGNSQRLYSTGLSNFLHVIKSLKERNEGQNGEGLAVKSKIVLASSISLYDTKLSDDERALKEGEVRFAKFIKHYNFNGRIVRLAPAFGPRMRFIGSDPVVRLIQASLSGSLQSEQIESDFSSRSLFVDDAVDLLIKSTLAGSTAQKIYDGALLQPVKVAEIKQILIDPLWYESRSFKPSELPPWLTPNLRKTCRELNWRPKADMVEALRKTVIYFRENNVEVPKLEPEQFAKLETRWSFKNSGEEEEGKREKRFELKEEKIEKGEKKGSGRFGKFIVALIIFAGIVLPFLQLTYGVWNIQNNLKESKSALEEGNFDKAESELKQAQQALGQSEQLLNYLAVLKKVKVFDKQVSQVDTLVALVGEGLNGAEHATKGSQALFQTSKIISGEDRSDPKPLYQEAQTELTSASQSINGVMAKLADEGIVEGAPDLVKDRTKDIVTKLGLYQGLIEKARAAAFLMPEITAVDGKKKYLILLENNLELRPTGGFIGSYARLDFEAGRLSDINVDDIYNLDGGLKEVIEPPPEFKSDLGIQRWYLRDSNFDPDFPTSARQAEFFYKKEANEQINGVITMDLTASGKLLDAIKGLDLQDYGEHVDGSNLFERAISHAEVGFFPGSQAKKNYLVSLQGQLFNKVFYLSKQNWPAIINAIGQSLEQKHILTYLTDPYLFSYLASSNWAGVMPRQGAVVEGETSDFLALVESNMGANKSNYYLERGYKLETTLSKEGGVAHKLRISYKNNSPSNVFPAGTYKNRLRVYLPLGAKLNKATLGESDITSKVTGFSDYGRSAYSMYVEVAPKSSAQLVLDYSLSSGISFKNNESLYKLDIIKQAGTEQDPFEWDLTSPINIGAQSLGGGSYSQEINISTDLQQDRTLAVKLKKR